MNTLFTSKDDIEGKIGIGKLCSELQPILNDISKEYYNIIPNKKSSTHHIWYNNMISSLKSKVAKIKKNIFWNKLCDGNKKCIKINVDEMDELYYSNPKDNSDKINLYGASGNYLIHRDNVWFHFPKTNLYRVLIGLSNNNDSVITKFTNFDIGHKIQKGDYMVFDFDKTTHQIIKERDGYKPRLLLKLHFLISENTDYSIEYLNFIKNCYIKYDYISRYILENGTDPKTYFEFFCGLTAQFFDNKLSKYVLFFIIILLVLLLKFVFKIKLIYKNILKIIKYILLSLISIYFIIVFFYWARYKLFKIK